MNDTFEPRFTLTDDPLELLRRMQAEGTLDIDAVEPTLRAKFLAMQAAEATPSANAGDAARVAEPVPLANGKKRQAKTPKRAASAIPPSTNGKNHNPDAPSQTTTAPGRDAAGKFSLGNCGGPGNPFARQVAALRQAALNRFDAEKIGKIFDKLYELALEGDVRAARLILGYTLGKPAPYQHPDGVDADEWQRFKENGPMLRELPNVHAVDPVVPLTMCRNLRDVDTIRKYGVWDGFLRQTPEQRKETDKLMNRGDVKVLDKWFDNSCLAVPDPSTISVVNQPPPSANGKKKT